MNNDKFKKTGKTWKPKSKKRDFDDLKGKRDLPISKESMNDPLWYFVNETLLKATASLAFPQWLGKGININNVDPTIQPGEATIVRVPFYYSIGQSKDANSPFNLAVRNLYTYVRHANSGHTNYESADLGVYLLAVGAAVSSAAHIERILGVEKYYQTRNAAVPSQLIEALGVTNEATLRANLANYTARLNLCWARLASLCLPKEFNFIKRWLWMCSQVFKDHESSKAAMYVFVPCNSCYYSATALTDRGGAFHVGSGNVASDFDTNIDNWFLNLELQLAQILSDEDMNIISGDILKAYGAENLLKFGSTALDYVVEPKFVEEMLPQIQNLRTGFGNLGANALTPSQLRSCVGHDAAIALGVTDATQLASDMNNEAWIYQVEGEMIETVTFTSTAAYTLVAATGETYYYSSPDNIRPRHNLVLNSYKEIPSPEDVVVSTRLMYTVEVDTRVNANAYYIQSSGTELIPLLVMFGVGYNNSSKAPFEFTTEFAASSMAMNRTMEAIETITQMDWFPTCYWNKNPSTSDPFGYPQRILSDIDNFTIVDDAFLSTLHTNAILGEFTVKAVNFLVS